MTSGLEDFHEAVRRGEVVDHRIRTHFEGNTLHVDVDYMVLPKNIPITIELIKTGETTVPEGKKIPGQDDYTLTALCGNCGHRGAITYQKGEPATDSVCPNCGNRTFHPQRKAWS